MKLYMIFFAMGCFLQGQPRTVTVCEILADLQSYRNKIVSVSGELVQTEEGTYLRGKACPKPLVTSGHVWPSLLNLERPTSPLVEQRDAVPSKVSVDPALESLSREDAENPSVHVWVTVTGRLETRSRFEMVLRGDGKTVPYGYGHLNGCPAQLVYQAIKDVVVEKPKARTDHP
jgi:hypothetical protein